ncbi:hypothetical protein CTI12_AA630270 [Artemisia annua]|uniref:Uncharacterized protein n=1 Tax=Artemisia annua TaxID=35608 RepID=A0A2U1K911_ARTAN|nr:hypothetical protein CTI12_AA630270 [Artemisia annua]
MDHLKDMGIRYRELAERKFAEYDYVEAKKLCQKAKDFFPGLNFLSTFIIVIDIYLSKEKIVNGEPDWYGILGLEKSATPEKLFERFNKLCNDIKLGEDSVIGVEGARDILVEACAALTGTSSWIECPRCLHKFSYYKERMNQDIFCTGCGEFFKFISRISESPKETASSSLNEDDKRSSNRESVKGQANKIRRSSRTIVRPSKYKDFIRYENFIRF